MNWRVIYQVRTLMDNSLLGEHDTTVEATDEEEAQQAALEWVHTNDPLCDDRVQPVVHIVSVDEEEDA